MRCSSPGRTLLFSAAIGVLITVGLLSGCATIATTVPPGKYDSVNTGHTIRVTPKNGDYHETTRITVKDSTLTIARPSFPEYDHRRYPVTYSFDDIKSVATIKQESLVYIESGFEHGSSNFGAASESYSENLAVIELGYMSGERKYREHTRWGFGGTVMMAGSDEDFRMGMKARARYRWKPYLSFDATAGPMLTQWNDGFVNGFVGGININLGTAFTIRSEYMTYDVPPWRKESYSIATGSTYVQYPGGTEKVWYNGVALRGTLGWVTAGLGTVALVGITIALLSGLPGSD